MLKSYLIAVVGIAGLMVGWAFVQRVWARVFLPEYPRVDVLERRSNCGKCGCGTSCRRSQDEPDEAGRLSIDNGPGL